MECAGVGDLRPNTLVVGWQQSWRTPAHGDGDVDVDAVTAYVDMVRDALRAGHGVVVCTGFRRIDWLRWLFHAVVPPHDEADLRPSIDVWVMVDDGGLAILLPHIMAQHAFWAHGRLRVNLVRSINVSFAWCCSQSASDVDRNRA